MLGKGLVWLNTPSDAVFFARIYLRPPLQWSSTRQSPGSVRSRFESNKSGPLSLSPVCKRTAAKTVCDTRTLFLRGRSAARRWTILDVARRKGTPLHTAPRPQQTAPHRSTQRGTAHAAQSAEPPRVTLFNRAVPPGAAEAHGWRQIVPRFFCFWSICVPQRADGEGETPRSPTLKGPSTLTICPSGICFVRATYWCCAGRAHRLCCGLD